MIQEKKLRAAAVLAQSYSSTWTWAKRLAFSETGTLVSVRNNWLENHSKGIWYLSFHSVATRLLVRVKRSAFKNNVKEEEPQGSVRIWEIPLGGESWRLFLPEASNIRPHWEFCLPEATSKARIRENISESTLRIHEVKNPSQKKLQNSGKSKSAN